MRETLADTLPWIAGKLAGEAAADLIDTRVQTLLAQRLPHRFWAARENWTCAEWLNELVAPAPLFRRKP